MTKLSSESCENFLDFLPIVLILSHGNATVERGFSINSKCTVKNQSQRSLIAQRHIYDAIQDAGDVEKFEIVKSLIQYMRNAYSVYKSDKVNRENEARRISEEQMLKRKKQAEIKELEKKRSKAWAETKKFALEIKNKNI